MPLNNSGDFYYRVSAEDLKMSNAKIMVEIHKTSKNLFLSTVIQPNILCITP